MLKEKWSVIEEAKNNLGRCLRDSPSPSFKFYGAILDGGLYNVRDQIGVGVRLVKECLGKIKK